MILLLGITWRPKAFVWLPNSKATKWLPAHFNFARENAPKLKRVRPSTLRDWPPCLPVQRDGGRQSRPDVNPFISALTVALCPATFPGVWPQFRDILSTSRSVGRGTGLSYTCRRSLNPARFFFIPIHKNSACFPAGANGAQKSPHSVSPVSHASRYNTLHFASQSRVPNGGFAPFGNPHKKRRYATPPRGAYRLFLLSSPPAVSVEQKSAWDWCGIFNYVKLRSPTCSPPDG